MAGFIGMKWTRKDRPEELQEMQRRVEKAYYEMMVRAAEQEEQMRKAEEEERIKKQVAFGIFMAAIRRGNEDEINEACDRLKSLGMYE